MYTVSPPLSHSALSLLIQPKERENKNKKTSKKESKKGMEGEIEEEEKDECQQQTLKHTARKDTKKETKRNMIRKVYPVVSCPSFAFALLVCVCVYVQARFGLFDASSTGNGSTSTHFVRQHLIWQPSLCVCICYITHKALIQKKNTQTSSPRPLVFVRHFFCIFSLATERDSMRSRHAPPLFFESTCLIFTRPAPIISTTLDKDI